MIDSRRDFNKSEKEQLDKWYQANVLFRFYKHSGRGKESDLTIDARKITGNQNISQAWLKMYEMLAETKLINKKKGTLRTFHLCEAPGSFIDCINYYIHTKTNIDKLEWNAQSLRPTKRNIIGDQFGILKRKKNQWHWGADGTGDITNVKNILNYKGFCNNIDLITSDCGLAMGEDGYHKVAYSSIVAILYLLPKGANMVFKIMSPINTPLIWNAIYICYQNFKKFVFFKPVQNNQSREFYIIGRDYIGTDKKILDKLLYYVKHFREDIDLLEDKYPEPFVHQVKVIYEQLAKRWTNTIQRQLYYHDNIDILKPEFLRIAKQYLEEKNKEWLKKYKLKYLESKYYL